MIQGSLFNETIFSVTELTHSIRVTLVNNPKLQNLWVQGEISNISRPASGHIYFTLKDSASSLRCVMWRNSAVRLLVFPRDGEAVEVHGSIDVYEAGGQYQLYADQIRPFGEGALFREFIQLKERLEAEGLFDPDRKRPIPHWPKRIGIVTSPTGAALRDILNTIRRRYPLVEIIISPTPVQGEEAPNGIVAALEVLNRIAVPDVILLARGGGSIEDLWAFNDERVARAIAASSTPVICGVGHETDFTIADFVSDLRAPTPTASAELATPNRLDLHDSINLLQDRQDRAMLAFLSNKKFYLDRLNNRLNLLSPQTRIRSDRQRVDELSLRMRLHLDHKIRLQHSRISGMKKRLEALNPESVLRRGYSIVLNQEQQIIRSIHQIEPGEHLNVRVSDGIFPVEIPFKPPVDQ